MLVDLGDVVVHIMQPAIRSYYNLEELWGGKGPERSARRQPPTRNTMRLAILAVGHKLPDWVAAGCAEYIKRMPRELPAGRSPRSNRNRAERRAANNCWLPRRFACRARYKAFPGRSSSTNAVPT